MHGHCVGNNNINMHWVREWGWLCVYVCGFGGVRVAGKMNGCCGAPITHLFWLMTRECTDMVEGTTAAGSWQLGQHQSVTL